MLVGRKYLLDCLRDNSTLLILDTSQSVLVGEDHPGNEEASNERICLQSQIDHHI